MLISRSIISECLASFLYVFIVCGAAAGSGVGASVSSVLLATALASGFTVATLTQCFAHISGECLCSRVIIGVTTVFAFTHLLRLLCSNSLIIINNSTSCREEKGTADFGNRTGQWVESVLGKREEEEEEEFFWTRSGGYKIAVMINWHCVWLFCSCYLLVWLREEKGRHLCVNLLWFLATRTFIRSSDEKNFVALKWNWKC